MAMTEIGDILKCAVDGFEHKDLDMLCTACTVAFAHLLALSNNEHGRIRCMAMGDWLCQVEDYISSFNLQKIPCNTGGVTAYWCACAVVTKG